MGEVYALVWWSRIGADQGEPWWVQELEEGSEPKRCIAVTWLGGTTKTFVDAEDLAQLPEGPRAAIAIVGATELRMVRLADAGEAAHE